MTSRFWAQFNLAGESVDTPIDPRGTVTFDSPSSSPFARTSRKSLQNVFGISNEQENQSLTNEIIPIAPPVSRTPWILLQFDGGANPNPGPASSGAILFECHSVNQKKPLIERGIFFPRATNNIAEWNGLLLGITMALERGVERLEVEGDSQLVVRQMRGEYRVRDSDLQPLYQKAKQLSSRFKEFHIRHVYRTHNSEADRITKEMLHTKQPYEKVYSTPLTVK